MDLAPQSENRELQLQSARYAPAEDDSGQSEQYGQSDVRRPQTAAY